MPFQIIFLAHRPQPVRRPSSGGRISGSRAAALVGVHRIETVGLFASFWSQKEEPSGRLLLSPVVWRANQPLSRLSATAPLTQGSRSFLQQTKTPPIPYGNRRGSYLVTKGLSQSDDALHQHGVGHLGEAGNVGTGHQVALHAVGFGSVGMKGLISKESPVGRALLGRRVGDRVPVEVSPELKYHMEIRAIEKGRDDESLDISAY